MVRVFSFLASFAVLSAAPPALAQTVYTVLAGDTQDPDIGEGVRANLDKMRAFLKSAAKEGNIHFVPAEIKDDQFSCTAILEAIRAVKAAPEDTVLFYYAGHGFRRTKTQTQFPEFDCRRSASADKADLSGVANLLLRNGSGGPTSAPRLLIAIADSCNVELEEQDVPRQAGPPQASSRLDRGPAFRQLFLQYSGTLLMSGSLPGTESWYLSSGGFFTKKLLSAINAHLGSTEAARWEAIADDATKKILVPTAVATVQEPQVAPSNLVLNAAP